MMLEYVKGKEIITQNDLDKRVLLLTKKMEGNYMNVEETPELRVKIIREVYFSIFMNVNEQLKKLNHLFTKLEWKYFKEPQPPNYGIQMIPTKIRRDIFDLFCEMASKGDSFHNYKLVCWLKNFRDKENTFNVELAFKLHFHEFHFEIEAYFGRPHESGTIFSSFKSIMESINQATGNDDDEFTGFNLTLLKTDYSRIPDKETIDREVNTALNKLLDYIEERYERKK